MVLHNYLRITDNQSCCSNGFIDSENLSGEIKKEEWINLVNKENSAIVDIPNIRGSRYKDYIVNMPNCLIKYLNREVPVSWQL